MNNNEIEEKVIEKVGFIVDSYHTRTGMPIFVVKKNKYISNEEFQILCLRAKKYKGYYSKFEENRGFIFYDKENANKFNNITEDEQLTFNQRSSQSEIGKGQSQSNERISPNDGSRLFGIQRNDEETSKSEIIDKITDIIEDDKNLIEYQNPEQVTAEEKINRFINKLYSIRDWDRVDSAHKYLITKDGFLLLIYLRKGDDFIKINVSEDNNLTFSNISVSLNNLPLYSSFDRRLDGLDINQLLSNYDNENHNIFTDEDNIDVNEEISKLKAEYSEYLLNLKDNEYSNNLYEENKYINQDVNVVDKHNILDAGERLEGAKKYLYQEILRCFNNVSKKNLIEFPLSKVFITPNITKLIKHNLIRESDAALIYAIISSIKEVKKPNRNSRAVEDYVNVTYDKIKALESFILLDNTQKDLYIAQIKKDNFFKEDFNDLYFKLSFLEYIDYKPGDTPDLNFVINHNQNSKIYNKKTKQYSYYNNKTNNKEVALNKIVTSYKFSHNLSDVYDENLLNVRERINYEDSKTKFILYYIKDNAYGTLSYTIGDENEIKAKSIIEQLENKNYQVIPQKEKLPSTFEIEYTEPFITGENYIIKTGFTTKEEALNYIQNNDLSRDIRDTINRVEGEKSNNKTKERINIEYNNRKWNICAIIKHSNNLYNFKSFETKKEAEQYLKENYNNLYEELYTIEDKYKNIEYFLPPQKRIGEDYRNGRDISPQEFIDTFGFRGVQFGNWTNDLDRRNALNEAYAAFLDLAKVTNIEPKQLSLNGTLGIAFGARGGGSAAAHYELNNVVINLTKTKGVGTLAHEWFHAVDNYLGRNYKGGTMSMITDNISTYRTTFPFLNNLNNVLRGTAYLKRSVKCGAYWGNINEVYARLFAEWTNYRLQELENRNNFLASEISEERIEIIKKLNYYIYSESLKNIGKEVNILPFEEFSKNEALSLSGFPYPTKNEVQSCSPHFTELFNQIGEIIPRDLETVNLQQIVDNEIETENQLYTESNYDKDDFVVKSVTENLLDLLSNSGIDVHILNESDNEYLLEEIKTTTDKICGFTSGSTIYLTPNGINPETPIHEYTHLWCKVMELTKPEFWTNVIVPYLKGSPVWNEVLADKRYSKIHDNDSRMASEVIARVSGRIGAKKLIKYAKETINESNEKHRGIKATIVNNMRKAVQKFWTMVKNHIFKKPKFSIEEECIADMVVNDLIAGETVNETTLNVIEAGLETRQKQYISISESQLDYLNNKFNEELEKQINGTLPNNHIYKLGLPSKILLSSGIPSLPLELASSRLADKGMQANHPFDISEIKNLVNAVQEPMAVFRSATHLGSFVILTEIEHQGRNFVVAIQTNKIANKLLINSIRSIHYRNNNSHIALWLQKNLAEYVDKEKMSRWLSKQQYNSADVKKSSRHVTKIIQNFENPILEEEKNKIFNNIDDIEFQFKQDYCNNFKQLDFKELKSKIKITEFAEYIGYKLRKDKTTHKHLIYEHSSGEKICIYNNPDGKPQIYMTIGGLNADKGDIISFVKNKIDNGIINKPINGTSPFEKVNILLHEYLNMPFEDRKVYNSFDEYIQKSKQNLFISDYQPYTGNITIKAVEYMSTRGLDSNDFLVYPFRGSVVGTNTAKIEADINKIPNNQVAFPLYDKNEKIVGVQLVSENYKSFLKGSRKSVGVWHSNIPESINNIVICEAPLDAISYHKLQGDRNTLYFATCGNVTDGQLDAIKSIIENNKNVLAANYTITLANDNDAAGAMFNLNYILSTLDEKGNTNIHFNNTKDGRCDLMISLSSADTNNLLKLYDNLPKEDINLEIKAKDGGVNILYSKDIKTISALNDLLLTSKPQNIKIDVPITKDYNEDLKTLQHINSLSSDKYSYQDVKHNSFLFTDDISKFHKEKKKHRGIKF